MLRRSPASRRAVRPALLALALVACAPGAVEGPKRIGQDGGAAPVEDAAVAKEAAVKRDVLAFPDVPPAEASAPLGNVVVYAHSLADLFRVDPETLEVTRAGNLTTKRANGTVEYVDDLTDIAVDKGGRILGLRYDRPPPVAMRPTLSQLVSIDPETAECTRVADLPVEHVFNGLSWIRTADGGEYLAATTRAGALFRLDPATGSVTMVGTFGPGLGSSGDLVSVTSYGTLATLTGPAPMDDRLARIDPVTGVATVIGTITGYKDIYGIGFWKNRVFGFTRMGHLLLIDPKTAAPMLIRRESAYPFAGAGVSTSVPVVAE